MHPGTLLSSKPAQAVVANSGGRRHGWPTAQQPSMGKAGVIAIAAAIALVVGLSLVERAADTGNVSPEEMPRQAPDNRLAE